MKEMTSVASAMMTEEEKEELERELNKQTPTVTPAGETPSTPPDATTSTSTSTTHEPTDGPAHVTPAHESAPESGPAPDHNGAPTTPTQASRPLSSALTTTPGEGPTLSPSQSQSGTSTPKPTTEGRKGKSKLTPEQKQKIDEIAAERDEAMIKRVAELTDKLKERLRPFVEAHEPGGKNDPETLAFEARMKREADDLKLESFGVEVRWLGRQGV